MSNNKKQFICDIFTKNLNNHKSCDKKRDAVLHDNDFKETKLVSNRQYKSLRQLNKPFNTLASSNRAQLKPSKVFKKKMSHSVLNSPLTSTPQKSETRIANHNYASKSAEQIWKNIVSYCYENNDKFVDDSFPPCDKSLFIDANKRTEYFRFIQIQWLSPEHIRSHPDEQSIPWSVYSDPKLSDIKQGLLGNCWLLSGEL